MSDYSKDHHFDRYSLDDDSSSVESTASEQSLTSRSYSSSFSSTPGSDDADQPIIQSRTSSEQSLSGESTSSSTMDDSIPLPPDPHVSVSISNGNSAPQTISFQDCNITRIQEKKNQVEGKQQNDLQEMSTTTPQKNSLSNGRSSRNEGSSSLLVPYHEQLQNEQSIPSSLPLSLQNEKKTDVHVTVDSEKNYQQRMDELSVSIPVSNSVAGFGVLFSTITPIHQVQEQNEVHNARPATSQDCNTAHKQDQLATIQRISSGNEGLLVSHQQQLPKPDEAYSDCNTLTEAIVYKEGVLQKQVTEESTPQRISSSLLVPYNPQGLRRSQHHTISSLSPLSPPTVEKSLSNNTLQKHIVVVDQCPESQRRSVDILALSNTVSPSSSRLQQHLQEKLQDKGINNLYQDYLYKSDDENDGENNDNDESWYDPDTMQRIHESSSKHLQHAPPFSVMVYILSLSLVSAGLFFTIRHNLPINNDVPSNGNGINSFATIVLTIAPSNLTDVCTSRASPMGMAFSTSKLPVTQKLYEECEAACMVAYCCVAPDDTADYCGFGSDMDGIDNTEACMSYREPCSYIHPIYGMLTREAAALMTVSMKDEDDAALLSTIEQACRSESLETQVGKNECMDICHVAKCCFDDEVDCWQSHELFLEIGNQLCDIYFPCYTLFHNHDTDVDNDDDVIASISDSTNALEGTTAVLESLCDPTEWENGGTQPRQICEDMCIPSQCCFSQAGHNEMTDCRESRASLCDAYQSCEHLYEYETPAVSMNAVLQSTIEGLCMPQSQNSKKSLANTLNHESLTLLLNVDIVTVTCHDICYPSKCCFEYSSFSNCWGDVPTMCNVFSECVEVFQIENDLNVSDGGMDKNPHSGDEDYVALTLANSASPVIYNIIDMACNRTIAPLHQQQETADMEKEIKYRLELCRDLCLPFTCCFMIEGEYGEENDNNTCDNAVTASLCSSYKGCGTFYRNSL